MYFELLFSKFNLKITFLKMWEGQKYFRIFFQILWPFHNIPTLNLGPHMEVLFNSTTKCKTTNNKKAIKIIILSYWKVLFYEKGSMSRLKHTLFEIYIIVTDLTFGSVKPNFDCTVRPKWQNFFMQNIEPFFRITFNANGILSYFCFAKWPTCTWSLGKIAKRMPTEPKLEWNYHINLKLFVCLLDLGFTPNNLFVRLLFRSRFLCAFYMFGSVRFQFGKQNFDWLVLFCSGRKIKYCFGRSLLFGSNKVLFFTYVYGNQIFERILQCTETLIFHFVLGFSTTKYYVRTI